MRSAMHELTDRVVESELVFGAGSRELEERLSEAPNDTARVALLDGMLLRRMTRGDARELLARTAAGLVIHSQGRISVSELCARLDCDYKRLERSFLTVVGLRPKLFGRLTRFVSALGNGANQRGKTWADAALELGYYDQAHFAREFKAFAGVAPSRFQRGRARSPTCSRGPRSTACRIRTRHRRQVEDTLLVSVYLSVTAWRRSRK